MSKLDISNSYRGSRRFTEIVCVIAICWAAAQLNIKDLSFVGMGKVEVSIAFLPIILTLLIIYMAIRCTLDFMMHPRKVRQWRLAQVDYLIMLNVVRFSLIALVSSIGARSLIGVFETLFAYVGLVIIYIFMVCCFTIILMPIIMLLYRARSKRLSAANAAILSVIMSGFIVALLYIVTLIIEFVYAPHLFPVSLLIAKNTNVFMSLFSFLIVLLVLVSFLFSERIKCTIFAYKSKVKIIVVDEDGVERKLS